MSLEKKILQALLGGQKSHENQLWKAVQDAHNMALKGLA